MLGAVRWELGSIIPKITAAVIVLSGWKSISGTKRRDARKLNMEKTRIHAPVQTRWMLGHKLSLPFPFLGRRSSGVLYLVWWEGMDPQQRPWSLLGVHVGEQIGQIVRGFQLWPEGKLQSFVVSDLLWSENLSYFVALSSYANTIFSYFEVKNVGWEEGSLISAAEGAELAGATCILLHG